MFLMFFDVFCKIFPIVLSDEKSRGPANWNLNFNSTLKVGNFDFV